MNMYEEYQLQWMIGHKYSLKELMEELDKYQNDTDEPLTVTELFSRWEKDAGFGSEIWACQKEWMDSNPFITKELIRHGLNRGIITFDVDPNVDYGTICKIRDGWFYFGGETAAELNPDEYLKAVPLEDIVNEIYDVLSAFKDQEETKDEYEYYLAILKE